MNLEWSDLAVAVGLSLAFEGILLFLSPAAVRRAIATVTAIDDRTLRIVGAVSMLGGLLMIRLVRS